MKRKALLILLALVLLIPCIAGLNTTADALELPAEEQEDAAIERLNQFAAMVMEQKTQSFGYPGNQDVQLSGFYQWLLESGLDTAIVNNAGDPFNNTDPSLNALDFEREVIEFFGPLYGFETDDLWGIVTFSGTDGNNHGIYFGSKYLEKKTQQKPVVYVSDAAHYSNMRLADLQNLELVLVPSDEHGCMIPEEFEKALADYQTRSRRFGGI